jgi:Sugar phosphate isomerases/epimerases
LSAAFQTGLALSPRPTAFGPVLFTGRLEQGFQTLHENGFKYVELSLRKVDDVDPKVLKDWLAKFDLRISALATGQACLFDSLCLCSPDDAQRRNAVEHIKNMVLLSKELGANRVIIGGVRGRLTGTPDQQLRQYECGVDSIRQCAQWAQEQGGTILIEAINRYEANWILTAREGIDLINALKIPSLKLLLDTFHMNIEEANLKQAFLDAGSRLGYVHLADNTRRAPGQGNTDFDEILETLTHIGFQGPLISEILPLPDDRTAVEQTALFWKKYLQQ